MLSLGPSYGHLISFLVIRFRLCMKCLNKVGFFLFAVIVGLGSSICAQEDAVTNHPVNTLVHVLQPGETLESLALEYFQDVVVASEIAFFNDFSGNIESNMHGWAFIIPLEERRSALTALENARKALALAQETGADTYAPLEYKGLKQGVADIEEGMKKASYVRVTRLGDWLAGLGEAAVELANANAQLTEDAKIVSVVGDLEKSFDGGSSWSPIEDTQVLPVAGALKTGLDTWVTLDLSDKHQVTLGPDSIFGLENMTRDMRNGSLNIRLRLASGQAVVSVKGEVQSPSRFVISADEAELETSGGLLEIRGDEEGSAWFVCREGSAKVTKSGLSTDVSPGEGVVVLADRDGLSEALAIPHQPKLVSPASREITFRQQLELVWKVAREDRAERFRVELARDAAFKNRVVDTEVNYPSFSSPILAKGDYFWRITGEDEFGLRSLVSMHGVFRIEPKLKVNVFIKGNKLKNGEEIWAGPRTEISLLRGDMESSVSKMELDLGDGEYKTLDKTLVLKESGVYQLKGRGLGLDGKAGPIVEQTLKIDADAPRVRHHQTETVQVPGKGPKRGVTVLVDDGTALKTLEIEADGKIYRDPQSFFLLDADKSHKIVVKASDYWGNEVREVIRIKR